MKARTLNAKKIRGGDPLRTTSEIVNYLTRHYQEQAGKIEENLLPEQINDLAQQMGEFLAERLEEDTHHKVVWADFIENPEENAASVSGILEALFEAQPAVRERVNGFMQEVTTIEAKGPNESETKRGVGSTLKSEEGGLITDLSGAINIALEGIMLTSAFTCFSLFRECFSWRFSWHPEWYCYIVYSGLVPSPFRDGHHPGRDSD